METSLSEGDCQLVVVDSPGLIGIEHAKRVVNTHSESKLLVDPENALSRAEHVIIVDDVTSPGEYIHHRVLHLLHRNPHITSTLVMNKCDLIKQRTNLLKRANILTGGVIGGNKITLEGPRLGKLGQITTPSSSTIPLNAMENRLTDKDPKWIEDYNKILNKPTHRCAWFETKQVFKTEFGWPHFSGVFFISAKTGEGIDRLRAHLQGLAAPVEEWKFEKSVRTSKRPYYIIAEHIRSALLNTVPADVAYKLKVKIMHFEQDEDGLRIIVHILCDKERWGRMVSTSLQEQMSNLEEKFKEIFQTEVLLEIIPKVEGKIVNNSD
jgi:GTP-binding protein Era